MILSGKQIQEYGLLIGADPKNYQAHGCDLALDKVYNVVYKPYGEKITEEDYEEWRFKIEDQISYYIPQNTSVLFKIRETVDLTPRTGMSHNHLSAPLIFSMGLYAGYILPKSSLSRRGVIVHSAWWDAGYKGSGFVLVRTSSVPLTIKPGDTFAQMVFFEASNTSTTYDGNYQGENIK
jgi:deoxycytidine triphosphate deaminase